MDRPLTLEHIPDELLAEYGQRRRGAIRDLLRGIRDDVPIQPVVVFREPGAGTAMLLDGLHRLRLSQALGFVAIPTTQPSREDAELRYRYARPSPESTPKRL
jgi:ParB-like chromosome segregation protein Spo0J